MKKLMCTITCLLAAVMMIGMMTISVAAEGETAEKSNTAESGYTAEDSYILNYNGKKRYLSVYQPRALWYERFSLNKPGTRTGWIFGLYNTTSGKVVDAYCMDVNTGAEAGYDYRRLNLEDSSYSESTAGLVRSILLNSFPHKTVDEVAATTNITGLTTCEAIMATQLAVWEAVHGELFTVTEFYAKHIETSSSWNESVIEEFIACNAEVVNGYAVDPNNEELIASHIEALYNYLLNLSPTAQSSGQIGVSNESFTAWGNPIVSKNEDGTYNVTVTATVNVCMTAADKLTLSAVLGDGAHFVSTDLVNGENVKTLTLENIPAEFAYGDVKLTIDGIQTVADVFLFDAEGGRDVSQTMVGITDEQMSVHAEIVAEQERVIRFKKHGKFKIGEENGNSIYTDLPLSGITFDLYLIAEYPEYIEQYVNGGKELPDPKEISQLGKDGKKYPDFTVVTDANGKAVISLTKNNLPDGVYVVSERNNDAIVAPIDPFYIMMPNTNASGDGWVYDVLIEPKNMVKPGPAVRKDVIEIEHEDKSGAEEQKASVAAGEAFTWIIRGDIPVDMARAKEYVITDELDYRLTFVDKEEDITDDVVVKVEAIADDADYSVSGNDVLVKDSDYTLTVTQGTANIDENGNVVVDGSGTQKNIQKLEVKLTVAGMQKVAKIAGTEYKNYEVRVYFNTIIDEDAEIGEEIPNDAELDYISSVGFRYETESDDPKVYTCGIKINKYNAKDHANMLGGAKFKLAKIVTQEEINAGKSYDGMLVTKNGMQYVKYVEFYNTADMSGSKVYEVETSFDDAKTQNVNEGGIAYMYGLEAGKYYLVETRAPQGYNLLKLPVAVTLDAEHCLVVEGVANSNAFVLPETGGIGTTIFKICGGVLIIGAVAILIVKKKKDKDEEEEQE